jgi:Domain of unknown function (DUF4398)
LLPFSHGQACRPGRRAERAAKLRDFQGFKKHMSCHRSSIVVLVAALVAGCASAQVPTEQLTRTKSAIRAAEEVGAPRQPAAALHLKLARDQALAAESLIEEGEIEPARMLLGRAELDAELALALAREERMRNEASAAARRVQELKQKTP